MVDYVARKKIIWYSNAMDTVTISKKEYSRLVKTEKKGTVSQSPKKGVLSSMTKIPISLKGILKGIAISGKDIAGARKSLI